MSNYVKTTDFAIKDGLPSGDPNKKLRGSEIDVEFEAIETAVATKADSSSPALTGTPTAPTAAASTNTTQIASTAHVKTAIALAFQGVIVLWSGAVGAIPSGWVLCDGTNGTPDLRDKFVVGAGGSYAVGNTAGSVTKSTDSQGAHTHGGATGSHVLTTAELPPHSHSVLSSSAESGLRSISDGTANGIPGAAGSTSNYQTQSGGVPGSPLIANTGSGDGHTHTIGSDGSHTHSVNVLPPYYALCYIMKT